MYAKQLHEIADKANEKTAKKLAKPILEKIIKKIEIKAISGKYSLFLIKINYRKLYKDYFIKKKK